tara:strand:- start:4805 stop:5701 length:897 start_codon:yes stop_codon:yes gene_type:complete
MIADRFLVQATLGKGAFSKVIRAHDTVAKKDVAIKIDTSQSTSQRAEPLVSYEARVLQSLHSPQHIPGIPKLLWHGDVPAREKGGNVAMPAIAIELLGRDLDRVLELNGTLDFPTIATLGVNLLFSIERMHDRGFVHRDIKPANILIGGADNRSQIYLADYGLAKKYLDRSGRHIAYTNTKSGITGTIRYCASHTHENVESSRRDDVESLAYVLLYLRNGHLPWQGPPKRTREEIGQIKRSIPTRSLCANCPQSFVAFVDLIRQLGFDEKPDYKTLRGLLRASIDESRRGGARDESPP